jgi:[NiFe] hydrogenase assembly HybE family chaperone
MTEPALRLAALEATFRRIATTRMRGVPVLHAALSVQAVGFGPDPLQTGATPAAVPTMLGVLVTPWCMNLLQLPLRAVESAAAPTAGLLALKTTAVRRYGAHALDFLGAHEPALGHYEQASLFSPMFAFADQPAAVATAREVMRLLRAAVAAGAAQEAA